MKKFNLAKVISLVFVCVMLLGALALSVFATEDEKVEIVSQNMYYGDTYQIMYAINAPEGATVKATDSKGNEINVVPFAETPTATVNGVENCKIYILEKGVAAQAIDEVITLTVEYGNKKAVKNYSVLQYIYERSIAPTATAEEVEMLQALLAYAVKADIFLDKATTSFDAYQYVSVEGATVNGINPTGMYAQGTTPFANLDAIEYDATGYELVITVNGEAKSLDELKALVVADATITVNVAITEKEVHTHDYVDGVCTGCGEQDPDYYFEMSIADVLNAEIGTKVIVSGTVSEIYQPWDDNYGNISVYITDGENKLLCFRMEKNVVKGDIITVTGVVGEFNGAIQLAQGCTADITGHDSSYDVAASEVTIGKALELADGTDVIVTGTVVKIGTPWSDNYGNISVTIRDENGDELYLFRLATNVNVHDVITVTGAMATYNSARQIGEGATAEIIDTEECTEYADATCTSPAVCVLCGAAQEGSEALGHVPGAEATCTEDQKCTVCGEVVKEATGHSYVDGACSVCGAAQPSAGTTTVYKADLDTITGTSTSYITSTTTSGWTATNAAVFSGGTTNQSPAFVLIGDASNRGVALNGKTSAVGKLTSATLTGGISKLTFTYGNVFSETNGVDITINIKQNGEVVATKQLDNNSVTQYNAYTFEWSLDTAIEGEFVIEIVNNSPSNSTKNKDRVVICDIEWTSAPAN